MTTCNTFHNDGCYGNYVVLSSRRRHQPHHELQSFSKKCSRNSCVSGAFKGDHHRSQCFILIFASEGNKLSAGWSLQGLIYAWQARPRMNNCVKPVFFFLNFPTWTSRPAPELWGNTRSSWALAKSALAGSAKFLRNDRNFASYIFRYTPYKNK